MTTSAVGDRQGNDEFERVHIELDWYDGPRRGLADVDGMPHYFQAVHDYGGTGEPGDEYLVWPASDTALALEREQWLIFVDWNTRYEAGTANVDSHPGHGRINARYDELSALLVTHRAVPPGALRLAAEWRWPPNTGATRYHMDGPDYLVRWRPTH
ncbi:MAG: hypothetical protein J2P28_10060 [Actinobacteria bacterium]|nr:hypothetical protein [Actinomycetota bacterium]